MSNPLCYRVYELKELTLTDNAILFQLAFAVPKDGNSVNIAMETLAYRAKCNIRTARRSLRRLEKLGYLISIGEKGGRGHLLKYEIIVAQPPVEESTPVVPPEHIPPPTNGHMTDAYRPHDPYKPEPLTPEQIEARKAKMEAARARIAEKPRPERKLHDRPGRLARERTGMVSGPDSLDGYSGGDETP